MFKIFLKLREEMAQPAVSFLLCKLGNLLIDEAILLMGIRKDVRDIMDELESIQPFLKDADARGETDEGVKFWVKQVRDIAYEIEDAVDDFMLCMSQKQRLGFIGSLRKNFRLSKVCNSPQQIATGIQEIKSRIVRIKERSERYGFNTSDQGSSSAGTSPETWHDPRVSSLYVEDSAIVGIKKPQDHLVQLLLESESRCTVISVAGMGGLGKTTLVKKVYDVQKVQEHFDCHAWITVSQSFKPQELLKSMMKQFYQEDEAVLKGLGTMEEVQLINKLREYLHQKRYVIVLDDIWSIESWNSMQHALPSNDCGSRVVITTRNNDVACYCKKSNSNHVYNLKPLPDTEAWRLFCKTAFASEICPSDLKDLSLKILKRCEGLPLAIVATSALLSLKEKTRFEWQKLLDNLGSEFETNPLLTRMTKILSLSFNDLPHHLKLCFLYFGIFPENYSIKCVRLFRLWTSEGFVVRKKGLTLEEVAEDYLKELIRRKLVQIEETYLDGRIRSCRVHDFLREVILLKSSEWNYNRVLDERDTKLPNNIRRISVQDSEDNVPKNANFSHIRSLLLFRVEKLQGSFTHKVVSNFKLVKVLDLQDTPLESLHHEICNLIHMRYLCVRNTKVKVLPHSIGKLEYLETLDLRGTSVGELPVGIFNLSHLRNLLVDRVTFLGGVKTKRGLKACKGIGKLTSLEKLVFIEAIQEGGNSLVGELEKLTELRRLGIVMIRRDDVKQLCVSIEKMSHLCSLTVKALENYELLDFDHLSSPPKSLQRLYLDSPLERLPNWILSLDSLVKLRLGTSRLKDNPIGSLRVLPNLVDLILHVESYDGDEICIETGGFGKLKVFRLIGQKRLNMVKVEKGAMPMLEDLRIEGCKQLCRAPEGIQHFSNLKYLYFVDMPPEFELSIMPLLLLYFGERMLSEKLPNAYFSCKHEGRRVRYSALDVALYFRRLSEEQAQFSSNHLFAMIRQILLDERIAKAVLFELGGESTTADSLPPQYQLLSSANITE